MSVQVVLLGRLRDLAGGEEVTLPAPLDWHGLLSGLPLALSDALSDGRIRVACDGALLADRAQLEAHDGSEVALLPPVSGG